MPPPKALVFGAFQSDLRDPKCWHNSCMIFIISFMKKKFQNFFQFFSVFWTPLTNKKIFLHFWAKNNLLLYTQRATCPFDPPKMLFRGIFYKLASKSPPVTTLTCQSPWKVGLSQTSNQLELTLKNIITHVYSQGNLIWEMNAFILTKNKSILFWE